MNKIIRFFVLTICCLSLAEPSFAGGATITIVNLDGAGEGFNDPTPAAPVGGNAGTTKGQQRLIAFQHAASIWGATLDSNTTVFVNASFDPLGPNVLGSAGATFVFANFTPSGAYPGPEYAETWYGSALADKRAGRDLNPGFADIRARFSSDFNFYLGIDNNHGALNDLVTVVLHELGHGLNFQNFVNESDGTNLAGRTDIYARHTLDLVSGQLWSGMTDAERKTSAVNWGNVVWTGADVNDDVPNVLSFGSPMVTVLSPASIAKTYQFGTASFGPPLSTPVITAEVVVAEDAADAAGPSTTDGCGAFTNAAAVSGKIALIDRGTCAFAAKTKNAQNAGAVAVIIANNAGGGPPGMGGTDPTIVIPTVSLSQTDGNSVKANLPATASLGIDMSVRAGASPFGQARLFAPNPVQPGSSGSHYDSVARRNLLMEPAINRDLTHSVKPPEDLSLNLLRDVGWFPDADLEGIADDLDNCPLIPNPDQADNEGDRIGDVCDPDDDNDAVLDVNDNCQFVANPDQANWDADPMGDACDPDDDNDGFLDIVDATPKSDMRPTVIIQDCDSGTPNLMGNNGSNISDKSTEFAAAARNHGDYLSTFGNYLNGLKKEGKLTGAQKAAIESCAAKSSLP